MPILVFFIAHYYLSLFTQTFYLHRYAAHKMFTMNKFWEKFFFLFTYICQGSSFLSPRAYALLHRMHHAYSDTEMDPHSPHFFSNPFSMMWQTKVIYNEVVENTYDPAKRFEGDTPEWKWLDWFGGTPYSRIGWGTMYVLFYINFATAWWQYLLLPLHFLMGPLHGAIVNWGGHKYGYQNFDNHDKSRNTLALDFLAFGELFQNNHHKFGMSPTFAARRWEFDPTYGVIWVLSRMNIIKLKNGGQRMRYPAERVPEAQPAA